MEIDLFQALHNLVRSTGFAALTIQQGIMLLISFVLLYLAIVKGFEPMLLIPIAFGMLLANIPHAGMMAPPTVEFDAVTGKEKSVVGGLLWYLYQGVKLGIYPPLIFMGVGAMTDFGPLIANPKTLLLGAAAQAGIFSTFIGALYLGFTPQEASAIGIIGGADGPTAIFVTSKLAPHLLGAIAIAAYSYMALVPIIQPPIMRLLTTRKMRLVAMGQLRKVSKTERIIFPIFVTLICALMLPDATPLVGMLMLGNLFRESGVVARLSDTSQNAMINMLTIFLGVTVGATANAENFITIQTMSIVVLGLLAFCIGTASGVLFGVIMYFATGGKVNPLIGSAGVSAVPMAARVSQVVGQKENPRNYLLMHAMGPNVAGVIGSAVAAGVLLSLFKG